jgi:hypothetical protein
MKFWTHETFVSYKDDGYWAKLRVKRDERRGEDYFDILIGKNGKDAHVHLGITLDQKLLFKECRGLVHKIGRKLESRQQGLLEDTHQIVDAHVEQREDLIFKVDIDPLTGRVKVREFGLKPVNTMPA